MADQKKHSSLIMVQGGTRSSRYEQQRAERRHRSEASRDYQDTLATATRRQDHRTTAKLFGMDASEAGVGVSNLSTHSSSMRGTPKLLLRYMNRDRTMKQECISQVIQLPNPQFPNNIELAFDMVCVRCLEAGEEHGAAQMLIKQSHRKFWVDDTLSGTLVTAEMPDPNGNPIVLVLAGTITTQDIVRCSNNCGFSVRIDNSEVWQV